MSRFAGVVVAIGWLSVGCTSSSTTTVPSPTPAPTFPGARALEQAQKEAAAGRLSSASDLLAEAQRQIEEAAPLRILSLELVTLPVQGYGLWNALPGGAVSLSKKEPLVLYMEPNGFARTKQGDVWTSDLAVDIELFATKVSGAVPFHKETSFLTVKLDSKRPNRELFYVLKLHIDGVPAGNDYEARVTLHDRIDGARTSATVPFKLVP